MPNHNSSDPVVDLSDPVIDEIREVRRQISQRFDNDPKKLVEHYMELQERYRERFAVEARNVAVASGRDDD